MNSGPGQRVGDREVEVGERVAGLELWSPNAFVVSTTITSPGAILAHGGCSLQYEKTRCDRAMRRNGACDNRAPPSGCDGTGRAYGRRSPRVNPPPRSMGDDPPGWTSRTTHELPRPAAYSRIASRHAAYPAARSRLRAQHAAPHLAARPRARRPLRAHSATMRGRLDRVATRLLKAAAREPCQRHPATRSCRPPDRRGHERSTPGLPTARTLPPLARREIDITDRPVLERQPQSVFTDGLDRGDVEIPYMKIAMPSISAAFTAPRAGRGRHPWCCSSRTASRACSCPFFARRSRSRCCRGSRSRVRGR